MFGITIWIITILREKIPLNIMSHLQLHGCTHLLYIVLALIVAAEMTKITPPP